MAEVDKKADKNTDAAKAAPAVDAAKAAPAAPAATPPAAAAPKAPAEVKTAEVEMTPTESGKHCIGGRQYVLVKDEKIKVPRNAFEVLKAGGKVKMTL